MSTYASRYAEQVYNTATGTLMTAGTALTLMQTGTGPPGSGTYVTTYTDRTKGTIASSTGAVTIATGSMLTFYADPPTSGGVDLYQGSLLLMSDIRPVPDVAVLASNVELGYAEKGDANATTTTDYPSVSAVSGLLISFTAPARPYYVELNANVKNDTTGDYALLALQESLDGGSTWAVVQYGAVKALSTTDNATGLVVRRRRNPTAGTSVQYRAAIARITGGTVTLAVDSTSTFPALAILSAVQV